MAGSGVAPGDKYLERVAKYIPGEVVAGYITLSGIVNAVNDQDELKMPAAWAVFILGVIVTPVYLLSIEKTNPARKLHAALATIAFVLWGYALGGPFLMGTPVRPALYYRPWLAVLLLSAFTWLAGLVKPTVPPETPTSAATDTHG